MAYKNLRNIPVYRKSLYLCELSRALASYISYNKDLLMLYQSNSHRDSIADSIITDAILIPQQIAQAEWSESNSVRLKSVTFIHIITRNILSYCNGLEKDGLKEKEYINLLRKEIKSFRETFREWRRSFGHHSDWD